MVGTYCAVSFFQLRKNFFAHAEVAFLDPMSFRFCLHVVYLFTNYCTSFEYGCLCKSHMRLLLKYALFRLISTCISEIKCMHAIYCT
jgi:hypothetical protein